MRVRAAPERKLARRANLLGTRGSVKNVISRFLRLRGGVDYKLAIISKLLEPALLNNYFDIDSDDDARTRREKVAGKIAILDRSLEDSLPYLFGLLGILEGEDPLAPMDGQVKKRRTLDAIKRILLRESLNQPLMIIFEDLHWIDEATRSS
jgi:hypothetical protein